MGNEGLFLAQFQVQCLLEECRQPAFNLLRFGLGSHKTKSGSQEALLPLGPLRTGLVPLKTSGSSTSLTAPLLVVLLPKPSSDFAVSCQHFLVVVAVAAVDGSFGLGMNVLMTEQMNQRKVAVGIFSPLRSCQEVMHH
jgi:hypothetical protein